LEDTHQPAAKQGPANLTAPGVKGFKSTPPRRVKSEAEKTGPTGAFRGSEKRGKKGTAQRIKKGARLRRRPPEDLGMQDCSSEKDSEEKQ